MTPPAVLIAQISDLHIKRPGQMAYGVVDTAQALERCVVHLNRMQPRPHLVVISGDLVDGGAPEEYAHLLRLLAPLELPYCAIPGNHDRRENFRSALAGQDYASPHGAANLKAAIGGLDVVLLDSSVPGAPHGELDPLTLAWLEATLAVASARPALVFLHHPPYVTGIAHMDRQNLRNAPALAAIVRRHPRVRMIAAGNCHRAIVTLVAGVPATICPPINHAVDLDLTDARVPALRLEPPAFHLHVWLAGAGFGEVVTHLLPVGDFPGPYPFFAADGSLM